MGLPTHRYWHSLIYDSAYHRLVTFGGVYLDETPGSSAWFTRDLPADDGFASGHHSWKHIGDAPTGYPRMMHAAVYDSEGGRMLVFGGKTPGVLDPTTYGNVTALELPASITEVNWGSQGGSWSTLSPEGSGPGATREHAAVYDPVGDRMLTFGGVNASGQFFTGDYNQVWALDFETPPAAVTLTGEAGKYTAAISWTAPGDDGNVGTAVAYDLRRSTSTITTGNFSSATQVTTSSPQPAGTSECAELNGLSHCTTYYYALKTQDSDGNWSAMSNVLTLTQKCNNTVASCMSGANARASVEPVVPSFLRVQSPANGHSLVEFGLAPELDGVTIDAAVFDVAGRRVMTLESGPARSGDHSHVWNLDGADGRPVPAGLYFVRVAAGTELMTDRIVVVR
jgi:hypothetical protein